MSEEAYRQVPASFRVRIYSLVDRRGGRIAIVLVLLAIMGGLAFDSLRGKSVTFDEPLHLTAGYAFWKFDDYRLQLSHGALPQRWYALPLLWSDVDFPSRDAEAWRRPGYLAKEVCKQFLFGSGNPSDSLILRGRLMAVILAMLTALAVYWWTARVFGPRAGLIACFLCALSPTILAHGRLMTSDVPAALFFLMSGGCFWLLLRRFTWLRLALSALCFGLLLVSKMSGGLGVIVLGIVLVTRLLLRRRWPVRLGGFEPRVVRTARGLFALSGTTVIVHAIAAVVIVWSCYGWQYSPHDDWDPSRDAYTVPKESVFASQGAAQAVLSQLEQWRVLPEAYLYGLAHTLEHSGARPSFLNGEYSSEGWWYYFPYCFLVKTPVSTIGLIVLGVGAGVFYVARRSKSRWAAFWVLVDRSSLFWSILVAYGAASLLTNLNIGHRHILPMYLPLFALAGAGVWRWTRGRRWRVRVIAGVLLVHGMTIAWAHPDYLPYFNRIAGGSSEGYRRLTDSNVDWGQDFPSLARWIDENYDRAADGALYFASDGLDDPARWGIYALHPVELVNPQFAPANPLIYRPGVYCFGATALIRPVDGVPWDERNRGQYVELLAAFKEMARTQFFDLNEPRSREAYRPILTQLLNYQYRQLRSYLMRKEPDAVVGNSILIYRVSEAELRELLLPGP